MTVTDFFGGKIRLAQSATGHRAGTDAILLAALVETSDAGTLVDAGAASGAAGLSIAHRFETAQVKLIDIDAHQVELARQNIKMNGFADRVHAVRGDLLAPFAQRDAEGLVGEDADCVITNPPYLDVSRDRISDDHEKNRAHVMPENGLMLWLKACSALLKPKGRLHLIHRADRLSDILNGLPSNFGAIRIIPVHARENEPAIRILVTVTKNSRAPLSIAPGFILHEADGRFTAKANALHEGEGGLTAP
ncbi:MAG: methyltransferase [Alphaproteobacteria bacterium]